MTDVRRRSEPRVSANELARYMVSTESGKIGIIRRAKESGTPGRIRYTDAMNDEFFVVQRIDEHREICISQLSPRTLAESSVEHLGGDRGYFIYEVDDRPTGGGIAVLAKAASLDAAFHLLEIWRLKPEAAA